MNQTPQLSEDPQRASAHPGAVLEGLLNDAGYAALVASMSLESFTAAISAIEHFNHLAGLPSLASGLLQHSQRTTGDPPTSDANGSQLHENRPGGEDTSGGESVSGVGSSWAPLVLGSDGTWAENYLRFTTRAECEGYLADLMTRWNATNPTRAKVTNEPVMHRWYRERGLLAIDADDCTPPSQRTGRAPDT